jgi:pilus assembly protein CpaD
MMHKRGSTLASLGAGMITLLAAGCATTPPMEGDQPARPLATQADRHEIKVNRIDEGMRLPVAANQAGLDQESAAAIIDYASFYRIIGRGPIEIATPAQGETAAASAQMAEQARALLIREGIPAERIAVVAYEDGEFPETPLRLNFARYTATAPECAPVWEENIARSPDNRPTKSFGCASRSNLAAMLADAGDLTGPRQEDPIDASRRQVTLDKWRKGEVTHAERSNDERIVINQSVK